MVSHDLIRSINKELETSIPENDSIDQLTKQLAAHINHLINHDFEKLVFYLYHIDVNEQKMKALLQNSHENAGELIANLIIERQLEKIKTKEQFRSNQTEQDDEEKW